MAKKIGLDTKKAKEYLVQKGERVGLGAAGVLTLLVLVLGFLGISTRPPANAGAPTWAEAIDKAAKKLEGQIQSERPPDKGKEDDDPRKKFVDDKFVLAKIWDRFFEPSIGADTKRRNPRIVKCPSGKEDIQLVYLLAPALRYQPKGRSDYQVIDAGEKPASLALDSRRLVLVNATFPVNEQLDEFVLALQAADREKLLAGPDAPRVLGLEVYRTEFLGMDKDGKEKWSDENPTPLYVWSEKEERTVLAKNLDEFFRQMVIDENNAKHLADVLGPNMATPLPRLATISGAPGKYPKIAAGLGIEVSDEPSEKKPDKITTGVQDKGGFDKFFKDPKKPPVKGEKEVDSTTTTATAPKDLLERFHGNFNVFDPVAGYLNTPVEEKDAKTEKKKKGSKTKQTPMPPKTPGKEAEKKLEGEKITAEASRLLLRFIDVDVEPAKKYKYHFRVRIANPNFGKTTEVSALDWSKIKELPAGEWTSTEPISIPQESFYYAVDQWEIGKITNPKAPLATSINPPLRESIDYPNVNHNLAEMTPVQIHRWINRFQAEDGADIFIGDWVIAERLLIKRGELIGRKKVIVEVPEWHDNKNRFDWGKFASGKHSARFTPVNFLLDETKIPVLVDFRGPKKIDDGATELLVLEADGKLSTRNSRVDSDPRSEIGQERLRHYNHWRERIEELRRGRTSGGGGKTTFPGGKGPG
jgi:hypothetical protein